ncbi:MAG: enolase C-terminal domain-like protein, partial [Microthrixaceae bacterium]
SYAHPEQLAEVDALGLAFIEQPFSAALSFEELAQWRTSLRTPVALDESLTSLEAVQSAVLSEAVDIVSVKPARLGGVLVAALCVEAASAAGVSCFVGGMLELGIGRAGAAAVAALPGCNLPTDLGPSSHYVQRDICSPICTNAVGELLVPTGPGIGRVPDEDQLQRYCVQELRL